MPAIIDWLLTGVNVVIEGVIVASVVSICSVFLILNNQMAKMEQSNAIIKEYTEYNQYDHTHVYPQDVTAAIMSFRGFPSIKVVCNKSTNPSGDIWSETYQATGYKAALISNVIDQNVLYDADIEKNLNGEVISITFKACTGGSYCGGR